MMFLSGDGPPSERKRMRKQDHAKCRYCGSRVSYWGEVCASCDPHGEHFARLEEGASDALWIVARADADRLGVDAS